MTQNTLSDEIERVENPFMAEPPPIHSHYSEGTQQAELCGRVVCPYGFVGIRYVGKTSLTLAREGRSMNKQLLLAVIEMLKVTLGNMPAKEADKIVSAAIDILETQV